MSAPNPASERSCTLLSTSCLCRKPSRHGARFSSVVRKGHWPAKSSSGLPHSITHCLCSKGHHHPPGCSCRDLGVVSNTSLSLTSHISFNNKSCALYFQTHPAFIGTPSCHQPGLSCHYLPPGRSQQPSDLSSSVLSCFLHSTPKLFSAQQSDRLFKTIAMSSRSSSNLHTLPITRQTLRRVLQGAT